jgi:integrase
MGRPRHQVGWITEQGPNWRGEFYTYPDGRRTHRSVVLGPRSKISKTEAKRLLAEIIARESPERPDGSVTLRWFIESRWLPMKKNRWKESTTGTNLNLIKNQIVIPLGNVPLEELDKFRLQSHLNTLADQGYSGSIVGHAKSFLGEILGEAHELDYIRKNWAARLSLPQIKRKGKKLGGGIGLATGKPFLSIGQLRTLLGVLEGRNRLLVSLCSVMAMRPGEALALSWSSYNSDGVDIVERIYRGKFDEPKTEASIAGLPVPGLIREMLDKLKTTARGEYVFQSGKRSRQHNRNKPIDKDNWLRRVLEPAGIIAVGTSFTVTFQELRRTFASLAWDYGADLKVVESVMRHAASKNFTVGAYQQVLRQKMLDCFEKFSEAALGGLPETAQLPVDDGQPSRYKLPSGKAHLLLAEGDFNHVLPPSSEHPYVNQ